MNIDKKLISIKESSNSVFSSDILQKYSIESILANPLDRTIWINGMPYGNAFILQGPDNTDNENAPINSEIFNDFIENEALGNYSHSEGRGTQTKNEAEHAEGMWNKSIIGETLKEKTISTIGIGTNNENRRNAFDVRYDGSIYIDKIGGYNENFADGPYSLQEVIKDLTLNTGGVGQRTPQGGEIFNSYGKYGDPKNEANKYSHAEGYATQALNQNEHAHGKYNKSIQSELASEATISSIGIGDSEINRNNALEVKQNGDIYIYGVANYNNVNSDTSFNVQKLLNLMYKALLPFVKPNEIENTLIISEYCHVCNSTEENSCKAHCIFSDAMKRMYGKEEGENTLANSILVVDRYAISKTKYNGNNYTLIF